MLAMYDENIALLDLYDDENTNKEVLILQYQDLYIHGFIEEDDGHSLYRITDKGRLFIESIRPLFKNQEREEKEGNLKDLCKKYLELFPKIKLPSGKYARSNIVEIEKKMKTFLNTYKSSFKKEYGFILTDEDILIATKGYIARYAKDNYRFMVTSSYFIQKNEKSALADEIGAIKIGIDKAKTNITTM